jgi:hypothetical protein
MGLLPLPFPSLAARAARLAKLRPLACALVIAGAWLFGTVHAHAQAAATTPYDRALSAYLEADFEVSRASAEETIDEASTTLADLARAHLLLALLAHVERADRTVLDAEVEAAVALDPAVIAPEGSPRTFSDRLEAARVVRERRRARWCSSERLTVGCGPPSPGYRRASSTA